MTTPGQRLQCVMRATLAACLLLVPTPAPAQSLAERLAPLALLPEPGPAVGVRCATPPIPMPLAVTPFAADPARANVAGNLEPLADGRPLRADQFPRFLLPTHVGSFGFTDFLVLGDYETVTFERVDADAADQHTAETWTRTGTAAVAGHLVSVFNPTWDAAMLRETLRRYPWGVDTPRLYWGRLVVPGSGAHVNVHLAMMPPNVPASIVIRVSDRVQYASHVVNITDADFGDSRILGGDTALNLPEITQLFYEHFADDYDVIAVVSQATQLTDYDGFRQMVRNDVGGIGLDFFDESATYGSASVLRGVEGYPPGGWASWETVLHEQGHQYGEYTDAWSVDRVGHDPDGHTPLLTPGAVTYGAVLEGHVRVGANAAAGGFQVEPTQPLVRYHPLTLYRMGLLTAAAVPPVNVFLDQGQFDSASSSAPAPGTAVSGGTVEVTVNDLLAADGVRSGPATTHVRRAVVYVSRNGLAPQIEMDVVNYFAQRLGESSGVTSWHRYPSFAEATGGRAYMTTSIRTTGGAYVTGPSGRCARVGTHALVGIELDAEFGGCLQAGTTVSVSGSVTLTDRTDYYSACLRLRRYGAPTDDRIYVCDELNVDRFEMDVTFPADKPGGYTLEAFAFWPESDAQLPLSVYTGAVEVLP